MTTLINFPDDALRLSEAATLRACELNAWVPVEESLPTNGSTVLIVLSSPGCKSGQAFATFFEQNPAYTTEEDLRAMPPALRADFEEMNAEINPNGYFGMSGGDWDAEFYAPSYSRQGMGYCEGLREPEVKVTHWRYQPVLPTVKELQ